MSKKRQQYSASFKSKVALAALKGDQTTSEIAARFQIHPTMVSTWKRELLENAPDLFEGKKKAGKPSNEPNTDELYREIGRLTVERDFLSRKARSVSRRRRLAMIERDHPDISMTRQCELLKLSRSSVYYRPRQQRQKDLNLMYLLDQQHLETPYYGSRKMRAFLQRQGYQVNRKRVQRLMRTMGLQAVYPRPRTSIPGEGHKVYPYLLKGRRIDRPNQVWAADITYAPLARGFMYLVAIMDWHTRKVLSWRVSNTLDADFCVGALEEALQRHGTPEIFNTDQGVQFTSEAFTDVLKHHGIRISMDGKGCYHDNIFVERLWRSVKHECIYLTAFEDGRHLRQALNRYFRHYNQERFHQSHDYQTPDEVYYQPSVTLAA
ncbi:IS3 family transposase [Pistricoccus aurantiacus]|uniref:IS3 family transposase n=1 Tax=Pistricoccus aurantiacus TaxID=1883414 RepID=A0A5B8SSK5_9GAMM|nr:IS3 family transposase [Pistricoccus aurantiacus]QEA38465.1 IS3 family transposase [Pistricoccus aurantiacus]